MSLNDYFAANGAVYLRPMGLPDCFTMPGLPHGIKPPPMPMQQKPRSMAAVSPLHQGIPPPPSMGAYEGGGFGGAPSNNRTSSFAAALRKLAKQAVDPVAGEKDPTQISPVASPSLNQGGPLTPKRTAPANSGGAPPPPPPMFHQGASYGSSSSPPVVTIAPSRPVATHTSESRKVVDLSNVPPTNNPISNGHMQQETPLKMDSSKGLPRHPEKWDESTLSSKGLSVSSASSQVRPHATIAPLPRPDDSVTSSRGFQPYRGGGSEESPRNTLPHHLSLFEHHHPSYPYAPAFLTPPHHLSHPAYRFDDPLYLERYSLLRPPMLPYAQPTMMGPPTAAFYPSSRYAADLIAQSLSISSANNSMLNHERLKAEEQERRIREKELELKEQERQRDREHREKEHKERRHSKDEQPYEHRKSNSSSSSYSSSSKRTESPNVRTTPVIHSTPNHVSAPTVVSSSSSIPLNLVLQEPQRKETTELWMPWQQPANTHAKDASQEMGNNGSKHPAFRSQDVHRHHATRENHTNDKSNLRFSPSALMDKKQHIPTNDPTTIGDKKHSSDHRTPDYRTQQDSVSSHRTQQDVGVPPHRTPASFEAKDSTPHEWRHEKLQKACTNIHRKVHESKRANNQKDGLYQNHHHHHRKAVNGALLKPSTTLYQNEGIHTTLYQNEGMHARLLESEKCRLEMNGHVVKSPGNTGLVVPSPYKLSSGHYQKDPPQKSFADYFGSSGVLLKSSVEVPPVVSKLDIELKKLKKGEKVCVEEEREERRMRNLLIIAKMPQLKFDSNPHKLNFLRLFGLTTHLKKKKVEFDMFLKRRKRLRQDSLLSPASLLKEDTGRRDEEEDDDLVLEKRKNPVEVEHLAERLRAEDTSSKKAEFLSMFGLKPFTLELREEKERLRRKVSEEKSRRHYRLLATVNRKSSPKRLFVPKSEAAQRLDQLKKLSEMNALPNGLTSKRLNEDEETSDIKHTPTGQTVAPKMEQVPYTLSPECNPLSKSSHKSLTKYSFKRGHSLKREFRFATPQSTYKSNPESLTNGVVPSHSTPPFPGAAAPATRCSVGTQVDANTDRCVAELKSSLSLSATIDTIMEVIYKNQTEQSSEKNVLSERCQQLRLTQEELKQQADALSRQMSDLLRSKRELDEERQGHQQSIDHLKKCLQLGR